MANCEKPLRFFIELMTEMTPAPQYLKLVELAVNDMVAGVGEAVTSN